MKRFIITGAPGAGKAAIIRQLQQEGSSVVDEAATDVIAAARAQGRSEPWTDPSFVDAIARLQKKRETSSSDQLHDIQFYDRSVVCTAALAVYLGYALSPFLSSEPERIKKSAVYEQQVFFIRNLGFITPTEARRITFKESLRFERIHEDTYREFGFALVYVAPGTLAERVSTIRAAVQKYGYADHLRVNEFY